ncbi:hypothetical protein AMJ39_01750 [candidate division TA06 bacterium DG_24]|jgi:hypothetical protein|uniref:LTD domain-containing protein n=3 Tax=Bacteria division TA06 TaxID=1156500 RepID=A0A0S8JG90_UNCT6|nr:MAG: hypothetical protein AMJ39_01750 [candidate division TA06 bacterium DG_24]KPK71594.1 MAG: hypothetical protein AMJ82_00480 [candidate division TA06 bacterium SM23_40]KPL07852.1 MAG: hypothetical protein AMJ71_08785 [candidate division TA06 bacterium SM1_40]
MRHHLAGLLALGCVVCLPVGGLSQVVFNEVYYDADNAWADNANEWVELYNAGGSTVDLGGLIFTDHPDTTWEGYYLIPGGTMLGPGEFLILCRDADSLNSHWSIPPAVTVLAWGDAPTTTYLMLHNDGEDIHLLDGETDVAVMWYGDGGDLGPTNAAPDVTAGHSLGLYPDGSSTGVPSDDYYDYADPTPGEPNEAIVPVSSTTWGKLKAMYSVPKGQQ